MTADNNARSTQVTTWRATLNGRGMPPQVCRKEAQKIQETPNLCALCAFLWLSDLRLTLKGES
jgi:hypothetical protein